MKNKIKYTAFSNYKDHYLPNLKLALPVIFSHAGQMVVGLVDTFMVGQLGASQLAGVSFANGIFIIGLVINIGISIAITPLVGKEYGAANIKKTGFWLKQGIFAGVIFALLQMAVLFGVSFLMPHMGQPKEVVYFGVPYFRILVVSILPFSLFMVFKQFAEGMANTRIAMVITLMANILNVLLNYLLIFGKLGLPEMGVNGAGVATLLARILMPFMFAVIFMKLTYFSEIRKSFIKTKISIVEAWNVIKIGLPIGGQMVVEVAAFSLGGIMMGWIGEDALAAHQIVLSIASLTYMMALGLSSAATIRVSNYLGAKEFNLIKYSAYSIVHKVLVLMALNGALFFMLRYTLPALFVHVEEVINIAAKLMVVAGVFQIFDGLQVVWLGVLRGFEDVKFPSLVSVIAYLILALPISYFCGFILGFGPLGIWIGYLVGLFAASILLRLRFKHIYKNLMIIKG